MGDNELKGTLTLENQPNGDTLLSPGCQLVLTYECTKTGPEPDSRHSRTKERGTSDRRKEYDRSKVYGLLLEGFTVQELRSLCYEKGFENLRYELPQGDVEIPEIAQKIMGFATRQRLFDKLLRWACKENSGMCEEFESCYDYHEPLFPSKPA